MAAEGRRSSFDLRVDLLKESRSFSFFQVLRLLRLFACAGSKGCDSGFTDFKNVRVRPSLSLGFPPADVDGIVDIDEEGHSYQVTATPLGLYGSSSPLPTFYTEDLLEEASEDESVSRAFVDIINHRLYVLLFRCWSKYRPFVQVVEEKNPAILQRLFSLVGLGEDLLRQDIPDAYGLIRYAGLLTQFPRSAVGLRALLQAALDDIAVQVIPCVLRVAKIPPDQRLMLGESGGRLGQDSHIGTEVDDRMGKFKLRIGPLDCLQFQSLLPGRGKCEKLSFLTRFYVQDPLEYEIELILAEKQAGCACLGAPEWSKLGLDTWIFSGDGLEEVHVGFSPDQMPTTGVGGG